MGNQVEETLNLDPGNAAGQIEETLTTVLNQGVDRTLELKVATPTGESDTITITQEGCREAFITSDGMRFVTSDGQLFGVLKDPCPGGCIPSYITLNQNLTDPAEMISGDVAGTEIQWIRDNSHRVLGKKTAEGVMTICQLDDEDSTKYADGATADLTGSQGDVFMRLPRFFYHAEEVETDVWKIGFSRAKVASDWKEWDGKDLIGVYKAYSDGTKLYSRSGIAPTTNVSQEDFKARSQANGMGYSLVKFKHHSMLAFLFYAMYGNTNSQVICGTGTSDDGKTTGQTNALGMTDTVAAENGNTGSINFWGLENWWGDLYEWVDNVVINNRFWQVTRDDGTTGGFLAPSEDGFISKVHVGEELDMIPSAVGASDTLGFCDYYGQYNGNALVLARSSDSSDSFGGVAYVSANSDVSDTGFASGSRLAFRGDIIEMTSSSDFVSIGESMPSYITIDQNLTDPSQMITGDVNGESIQWIRENSHRVLGKKTAEGVMTVCQLDDEDSTKFADGGSADLTGGQGDVFMKLPRFFYHAEEVETDVWKIGFSRAKVASDWKEWDGKDLVGVYEGYVSDGKLRSVSGETPTDAVPQADFKAYAQANGDGYSLVKFKHHSMMAFLFYALYGNTNSQAICGTGSDVQGKTTGATNGIGMTDTVAEVNGNTGSINFWGLENWWGSLFERVDNVSINNNVWTITEDGGSTRDVQAVTSDGFISKVHVGENLDIVPSDVGASDTLGFCDYYGRNDDNALVLSRSCSGSFSIGGVAFAYVDSDASLTEPGYGSRLAFRGTINEIESSVDFTDIEAIS